MTGSHPNAFHPKRFDYPRFSLALAIGALGTVAFLYFEWPLPWMLGPMFACTLAALLRLPVRAPSVIRPPVTVVIGVLLGASFSADMISDMVAWIPTLAGLTMFLCVAGAICIVYFRKVGGYDLPTAYFAGMPGGLVEMVLLAQARGGDTRRIALVHAIRILLTVSSLPLLISALGGGDISGPASAAGPGSPPIPGASLESVLWLVVSGALGVVLGRWLKLPAPDLLGPMLISGIVHLVGWTHLPPPPQLVSVAQLVLGVSLGCRFIETSLPEMLRTLLLSLGSFAILIACAIGFAYVLATLTSLDVVSITLAYAPGGLVETSIIALALQIEVAFVATHHIMRVVIIMAAAAPIFKWIGPNNPPNTV